MGLDLIRTDTIQQNFIMFGELLKGKINKRFRHIIWLATTWCIWRSSNILVVDQIIYMSWFWYSGRVRSNVDFPFSTWCNNPLACFLCT
jgi:hypothetical protein